MKTLLQNIIDDMKINHVDRYRGTCPSCHSKDTFTCTYDSFTRTYKYNCYKLSCNLSGHKKEGGSMDSIHSYRINREARRATHNLIQLPPYLIKGIHHEDALKWLQDNNAIQAYEMGAYELYTDLQSNRIVVPLYYDNTLVNLMGRAWDKDNKPKVKLYERNNIVPPFKCGYGHTLVIVEDFASAANVATIKGCIGFAILGTHFTLDRYLYHIRKCNPTKIVVALDKDAIDKSYTIAYTLRFMYPDVVVLPVVKDIKYYTQQELMEIL